MNYLSRYFSYKKQSENYFHIKQVAKRITRYQFEYRIYLLVIRYNQNMSQSEDETNQSTLLLSADRRQ